MKSTTGSRNVIRHIEVAGIATALIGAIYTPARAQLLTGQTLQLQGYYPSLSTAAEYSFTFVSNPGLDFQVTTLNAPTGVVPVNILTTDSSITLLYPASDGSGTFATSTFNGYVFKDFNNTIPAFTGAKVDSSTTLPGFGTGNLTFDSNDVYVNVSGLSFNGGNSITIDLSSNTGAVSAPEPGTLPLLGSSALGLAFAGFRTFRRKRLGNR